MLLDHEKKVKQVNLGNVNNNSGLRVWGGLGPNFEVNFI